MELFERAKCFAGSCLGVHWVKPFILGACKVGEKDLGWQFRSAFNICLPATPHSC